MTIDETIAKYKEITNTDAICPVHCNISCDKCVQESKQLVVWLEELKSYKEKHEGRMWDEAEMKGYNNAIDDFANTLKENYDYLPQILSQEAFCGYIDEYAEQLKAGVKE